MRRTLAAALTILAALTLTLPASATTTQKTVDHADTIWSGSDGLWWTDGGATCYIKRNDQNTTGDSTDDTFNHGGNTTDCTVSAFSAHTVVGGGLDNLNWNPVVDTTVRVQKMDGPYSGTYINVTAVTHTGLDTTWDLGTNWLNYERQPRVSITLDYTTGPSITLHLGYLSIFED
jgi:hypothetical protein